VKIILLSGNPGTGKSTTLSLLFDRLTECGKKNIVSAKVPQGDFDFESIVQCNNKTVAIVTFGDVLHGVVEAIVKYANLDVLVLAYSSKFSAEFDTVVGSYDYHCVIKKECANDSDNARVCDEILAQI
jgi:broad-specificity NMP kinase